MQVTVDGQPCTQLPFVSAQAAAYPDLGCRIEVRESHDLNPWHHSCKRGRYYGANALVNFHGQVLAFDCHLVGERHLHYLIDLTGEPTGLRLMLPARTCLAEDDAFNALKVAVELEAYRARRWVVERTHLWFNRFRRLLIRWEKKSANYLAFLHFACAWVTFRAAGILG